MGDSANDDGLTVCNGDAGLIFDYENIENCMADDTYNDEIDNVGGGAGVYLAAVLEYITGELLELARNVARDEMKLRILPYHIISAIKGDEEMNRLFGSVVDNGDDTRKLLTTTRAVVRFDDADTEAAGAEKEEEKKVSKYRGGGVRGSNGASGSTRRDLQNKKKKKKTKGGKEAKKKEKGKFGKCKKANHKPAITKVAQQIVSPEMTLSKDSLELMNALIEYTFVLIVAEAVKLAAYNKKMMITSREIQTAVRLMLPGELAKHAVSEGTKAVTKCSSFPPARGRRNLRKLMATTATTTETSFIEDVNYSAEATISSSYLTMMKSLWTSVSSDVGDVINEVSNNLSTSNFGQILAATVVYLFQQNLALLEEENHPILVDATAAATNVTATSFMMTA